VSIYLQDLVKLVNVSAGVAPPTTTSSVSSSAPFRAPAPPSSLRSKSTSLALPSLSSFQSHTGHNNVTSGGTLVGGAPLVGDGNNPGSGGALQSLVAASLASLATPGGVVDGHNHNHGITLDDSKDERLPKSIGLPNMLAPGLAEGLALSSPSPSTADFQPESMLPHSLIDLPVCASSSKYTILNHNGVILCE
jgi:hypothetical protein